MIDIEPCNSLTNKEVQDVLDMYGSSKHERRDNIIGIIILILGILFAITVITIDLYYNGIQQLATYIIYILLGVIISKSNN